MTVFCQVDDSVRTSLDDVDWRNTDVFGLALLHESTDNATGGLSFVDLSDCRIWGEDLFLWEILLLVDVLDQNVVLVLRKLFTHGEVALSKSHVTSCLAFLRSISGQIYALRVVTLRFCHGRKFS